MWRGMAVEVLLHRPMAELAQSKRSVIGQFEIDQARLHGAEFGRFVAKFV